MSIKIVSERTKAEKEWEKKKNRNRRNAIKCNNRNLLFF